MGYVVVGNKGEIASAVLACIERNAPDRSYLRTARDLTSGGRMTDAVVQRLLGVLASVRKDIAAGYGATIERRVREDVFEDFLSMAEAIIDTRGMHPAPAVVLAVGVLEDHVRTLAAANDIEVEKPNGDYRSFEDLVNDLAKEDVLGRSEKRLLGGWYAQRTDAAHGHFDRVLGENVPGIIVGVRTFIQQHPS